MIACELRNGKELSSNVKVADSLLRRMKGLLGRSEMPTEEALWIKIKTQITKPKVKFNLLNK